MYYTHSIPGRLRIKGEEFKRRKGLEEELRQELSIFDGIKEVDYNPTTGSIVIRFDQRIISAGTILEHLEKRGYFSQDRAIPHEDYLIHASLRFGKKLGKILSEHVSEPFLAGSPLVLLFKFI